MYKHTVSMMGKHRFQH